MLDEAFREITKTALKESNETLDYLKDCELDFSNPEALKESTGLDCLNDCELDSEEGDREWRTPRSSVDGSMRGNGYHTPAYLSPGITRKLQLNKDMELPFLAARS